MSYASCAAADSRTEKWSDLRPGKHQLHCEILKETDDPKGGHEVRLMALMSV